jgi:TPR repeat protein
LQREQLPGLVQRLRVAVAGGDAVAMSSLAYLMKERIVAEGRNGQASELVARAARLGEPAAQLELASSLQQRQKARQALPWLRRSAEGGLVEGMFRYALALLQSPLRQRRSEGMRLLARAHRRGHDLAAAHLAWQLDQEPGDKPRAARWYRIAAARGDSWAMHNLAAMYENGEGVRRNLKTARQWYALAARGGIAESKSALVRLRR